MPIPVKPSYPRVQGGPLARDLVFALPVVERNGATLYDVGPRRLNGTLGASTAAPAWGSGDLGTHLVFDGTNDYVSLPTVALQSTQKLAISMWLWWDTNANNDDLLLETSVAFDAPNVGAFVIDWNHSSGNVLMGIRGAGGGNHSTFPRPTAAAWHHVVIGIDTTIAAASGQFALRVDGALVTPTVVASLGGNPVIADYAWYLMSRAGTTLFGAGRIADLRVWRRLLTVEEIEALAGRRGDPWEMYRPPRSLDYLFYTPPATVVWTDVVPEDDAENQSPINYAEAVATPIDDATEPAVEASIAVTVDGVAVDSDWITVTPVSFGGYRIRATFPFLLAHAYAVLFSIETANGTVNELEVTFTTRRRLAGGSALASWIVQAGARAPALVSRTVRPNVAAPALAHYVVRPSGITQASDAFLTYVVLPRTGGVLQARGVAVTYLVSEFARQTLATFGAMPGTAEADQIAVGADVYGTTADPLAIGADLAITQGEPVATVGADVGLFSREPVATAGALVGTAEADALTAGGVVWKPWVLARFDVDIQSVAQQEIEEEEP